LLQSLQNHFSDYLLFKNRNNSLEKNSNSSTSKHKFLVQVLTHKKTKPKTKKDVTHKKTKSETKNIFLSAGSPSLLRV